MIKQQVNALELILDFIQNSPSLDILFGLLLIFLGVSVVALILYHGFKLSDNMKIFEQHRRITMNEYLIDTLKKEIFGLLNNTKENNNILSVLLMDLVSEVNELKTMINNHIKQTDYEMILKYSTGLTKNLMDDITEEILSIYIYYQKLHKKKPLSEDTKSEQLSSLNNILGRFDVFSRDIVNINMDQKKKDELNIKLSTQIDMLTILIQNLHDFIITNEYKLSIERLEKHVRNELTVYIKELYDNLRLF